MKFLDLNITTLMLRFYLLMAIVIAAGFSGYWSLALLALPVFFSALMGISFTRTKTERKNATVKAPGLHKQMNKEFEISK
jgi:hypothetical protein